MSAKSYAIVQTGGKQYRVSKDETIDVELLKVEVGSKVEFKEVLFYHDGKNPSVGAPSVAGCTVKGELIGEVPGPKVTSVKYKRRKNQRRKWGHRQHYSRVKITEIKQTKPRAKKEEEK